MTATLLAGYAQAVTARRAERVAQYAPDALLALDLRIVHDVDWLAVARWARTAVDRLVAITLDTDIAARQHGRVVWLLDLLDRVPEPTSVLIACFGTSVDTALWSRACVEHFPIPRYADVLAAERETGAPLPQAVANAGQIARSGSPRDAPTDQDRDYVQLLFTAIRARDIPAVLAAAAAFSPATVLALRERLARRGETLLVAQVDTLTENPIAAAIFVAGAAIGRSERKDSL